MPYLDRPTARLFYEDDGAGPPILATHGLAENHLYWKLPGVSARLVEAGYRVVSMDMRGHGLSSVTGERKGFEVGAIAGDIGALADHLGLETFHLLTHATGGMAGYRYAASHSARLKSLMATNTGPATVTLGPAAGAAAVQAFRRRTQRMAAGFRGRTWLEILSYARANARSDVFLNRLHMASEPQAAFGWYERCSRLGSPDILAEFIEAFYDDPDPKPSQLAQIACPCLILVGEHDEMFLEPSREAARAVPNARLVILEGRGHMTAFEDPEGLSRALLSFLNGV